MYDLEVFNLSLNSILPSSFIVPYLDNLSANLLSFNNDEYKDLGNYILIVVNGISVREEPDIGQFLNGNIFILDVGGFSSGYTEHVLNKL